MPNPTDRFTSRMVLVCLALLGFATPPLSARRPWNGVQVRLLRQSRGVTAIVNRATTLSLV